MWWKWSEYSDNKFLSKVKDPVQRDGYLKQLIRVRSNLVIAIVIFALLAIAEIVVDANTIALSFLLVLIATRYVADLQIKMIKLFSSTQQERGDNTPKTY